MRRIRVEYSVIKQIAEECRCDRTTVSRALNAGSCSVLARQIRALALAKYNGQILREEELEPLEGEEDNE